MRVGIFTKTLVILVVLKVGAGYLDNNGSET